MSALAWVSSAAIVVIDPVDSVLVHETLQNLATPPGWRPTVWKGIVFVTVFRQHLTSWQM
jgi:hypothetical protein